tara:strand:+ start:4319 stop:4897 length:579 start_codon:yes stop_codon:yes gene_type:complete
MSDNDWSFGENMMTDSLGFYPLYKSVKRPIWGTDQSACFDLYAHLEPGVVVRGYDSVNRERMYDVTTKSTTVQGDNRDFYISIPMQNRVLIPTGLIFDIPEGFSVRLHSRSSLSLKKGLMMVNGEGIIDSDYYHECYMMLYNSSNQTVEVGHGERIAQAEMIENLEYEIKQITEMPTQKTDRVGGFGSTGVK